LWTEAVGLSIAVVLQLYEARVSAAVVIKGLPPALRPPCREFPPPKWHSHHT